jgi:hypothetical protein
VPLNQDKKESIEAAATTAEELLGDLPVDYIINNAAYVSLSVSFVLRSRPCHEEGPPVHPDGHSYKSNILTVHPALGIRQT